MPVNALRKLWARAMQKTGLTIGRNVNGNLVNKRMPKYRYYIILYTVKDFI